MRAKIRGSVSGAPVAIFLITKNSKIWNILAKIRDLPDLRILIG
jgi:hypothetical protein